MSFQNPGPEFVPRGMQPNHQMQPEAAGDTDARQVIDANAPPDITNESGTFVQTSRGMDQAQITNEAEQQHARGGRPMHNSPDRTNSFDGPEPTPTGPSVQIHNARQITVQENIRTPARPYKSSMRYDVSVLSSNKNERVSPTVHSARQADILSEFEAGPESIQSGGHVSDNSRIRNERVGNQNQRYPDMTSAGRANTGTDRGTQGHSTSQQSSAISQYLGPQARGNREPVVSRHPDPTADYLGTDNSLKATKLPGQSNATTGKLRQRTADNRAEQALPRPVIPITRYPNQTKVNTVEA